MDFKRNFTDPIVIMGPVTSRGSDPVTTLVKNITKSTFYWQM
jgi:hypothetical protein